MLIVPKPFQDPEFVSPDEERSQRALGVSGAAVESVPRRGRRKFAASEKQRILKTAAAAVASGERGALESLMRSEGIYRSQLSAWRKQLASRGEAGLSPAKPGRKAKLSDKDLQVLALTEPGHQDRWV